MEAAWVLHDGRKACIIFTEPEQHGNWRNNGCDLWSLRGLTMTMAVVTISAHRRYLMHASNGTMGETISVTVTTVVTMHSDDRQAPYLNAAGDLRVVQEPDRA